MRLGAQDHAFAGLHAYACTSNMPRRQEEKYNEEQGVERLEHVCECGNFFKDRQQACYNK
jgi:hypothetical protein